MENIKLVTYSTDGLIYENDFENMNQLKKYVKTCGGFNQLGDYEIYTQNNQYKYNIRTKTWNSL